MKKAWASTPIIIIIALIFPITAAAEFYRYEDPHGNVIYTDDLSNVPIDKRPQAKMYDESRSRAPASPEESQTAKAASPPSAEGIEAVRQEGLRLQTVQEGLSQEYDALSKENTALKAEQQEAVTPDQRKAVNKKVVSFNTRFKAYQEKEAVYKTELEAYDQRAKAIEADQQKKK